MEQVRLVYFDVRGLAEPIRWMLKISGIEFIDERIALDEWTLVSRKGAISNLIRRRKSSDSSGAMKRFVGQLPILTIGDFYLTQPLTVLRYLARRTGFAGETPMEEARAEEISDLVYDLRLRAVEYEGKAFKSKTPDIVRHTVFRDFRSAPESTLKTKMKEDFSQMYFPLYFSKFSSIMDSTDGEWACGANLTYGDFVLANFLDIAEDLVDPTCLAEFPKLRNLKEKVLAIPEIEEWRMGQNEGVRGSTFKSF